MKLFSSSFRKMFSLKLLMLSSTVPPPVMASGAPPVCWRELVSSGTMSSSLLASGMAVDITPFLRLLNRQFEREAAPFPPPLLVGEPL
uniref:Putative secreted protein n=1 Tax=Anopheles darlingi TaxID=43151 RepID=A0A2M4DJ45_ANODA